MDERIVDEVSGYMTIEEVEAQGSRFRIKGNINQPIPESIKRIKEHLEPVGYFPLFRVESGKEIIECVPYVRRADKPKVLFNLILFVATIFSTLLVGSMHQKGSFPTRLQDLVLGIPFSFSLMTILTLHELGHYFVARRSGVKATLPYFLPIPHPLIGTFGAIIRIKTILPNRQALARLGLAGPICGFLAAVPITIIGLKLSQIRFVGDSSGGIVLGESILFSLLNHLIHPNLLPNQDVFLHPMAYAGWLGLLVTAMNLMPIGQLDGGHIAYALLGRKRRYLIPIMIIILFLVGREWAIGWLLWVFIAIVLSLREPIVQDNITPLSVKDKITALIPYLVLILAFTPVPFMVR